VRSRPAVIACLLLLGLGATPAAAGEGEPFSAADLISPPDEHVDVMRLLSKQGLHDLEHEAWNLYGQFTYISNWKLPFHAAYSGVNSLSPDAEQSFTASLTFGLSVRLWRGAELYFVPEVIAEKPLSGLHGLGGAIQNFELQKTGGTAPQLYRSRAFLKQTFNLGGAPVQKSSELMQLGATVDARRIVLTLGNFSTLDVLDKNTFSTNPRQQFLNMVFMTHAAFDFASDARGYAWGGAAEVYFDEWALRFARMSPPQNPNVLPVGLRLDQYYGDQLELEHQHVIAGLAGAVRLLGFRNREVMGRFSDAVAAFQADPSSHNAASCGARFSYDYDNASVPDLCWARKPNVKLGLGVNLEQHLTPDIGVFFRGMYADGLSEVQAYTSSDRSISLGVLAQGTAWRRPADVAGVGGAMAWISREHAQYLALGGIDGFIGDGRINAAPESVFEVFYSVNLLKALWVTVDYQRIWNPAFNADRGPVDLVSGRLHAEF
jgi:hypothetical protein